MLVISSILLLFVCLSFAISSCYLYAFVCLSLAISSLLFCVLVSSSILLLFVCLSLAISSFVCLPLSVSHCFLAGLSLILETQWMSTLSNIKIPVPKSKLHIIIHIIHIINSQNNWHIMSVTKRVLILYGADNMCTVVFLQVPEMCDLRAEFRS